MDPVQEPVQDQKPVESPVETRNAMPPEAQALLEQHRKDAEPLMNFVRSQEAAKYQAELDRYKADVTKKNEQLKKYQEQLSAIEGQKIDVIGDKAGAAEEGISELRQALLETKSQMAQMQQELQATKLTSIKAQMLSAVPTNVLPVEFHSLIQGNTPEEIQTSIQTVVGALDKLKQPQQQQAQIGQMQPMVGVTSVPGALTNPDGVSQQGIPQTQAITPELIQEMTRGVMSGAVSFEEFENVAGQAVGQQFKHN